MIVMIETRRSVREGFAALFDREGLPLDGLDPDLLPAWLDVLSDADAQQVEFALFGGQTALAKHAASEGCIAKLRSHVGCPLIAINEEHGVDVTLRLFARGMDDVVKVPIHPRELLARAAAIRSRRGERLEPILRFGDLTVHADGRDPEVAGMALSLPRRERRVLDVLARSHGRYVTKAQLYASLYGVLRSDIGECVVESHVSKLRRKLRLTLGGDPITSTRFLGYRMDIAAPSERALRA